MSSFWRSRTSENSKYVCTESCQCFTSTIENPWEGLIWRFLRSSVIGLTTLHLDKIRLLEEKPIDTFQKFFFYF